MLSDSLQATLGERLKAGDSEALDEQLRLKAAQEENIKRLAALVGTE